MDIKKFWDTAVSYEEYLKRGQAIVDDPKTAQQKEFLEYYKLGMQRMHRMMKTYTPDAAQLHELKGKSFSGKILIISEQWCGDASAIVPVIHKFFENNEMRITYRDQEPSLINDYLTNGKSKSIPIVLFLDKDYKVIAHWGPRPKFGRDLYLKHKANPKEYNEDEFHNDMQVYYAKNKGIDIVSEVLALI